MKRKDPMARNFGWTLTDANRSTRSGLVSFRYNMLRRQYVGACTALQVPTIITTATNNSARNGDSRRGVFQDDDAYMRDPWLSSATYSPFRRQPSQGSDSCFGSEFPSLTSTGDKTNRPHKIKIYKLNLQFSKM